MIILSHRGYWKDISEKNTPAAFKRSFELGFGTEFDIRDYQGRLVISHDIAGPGSLPLDDFFDIYCAYDKRLFLAVNIKADGLQNLLLDSLKKFGIENYFVFDMSVPDALGYLKLGMKAFTRLSEYESVPSFYDESEGVWMDEFSSHWITAKSITSHLANGKKVAIVSPELHKRNHLPVWEDYRALVSSSDTINLMLCTDLPEEAKGCFHD
jgi:glycerophosphoryl diester phosphodiesterase